MFNGGGDDDWVVLHCKDPSLIQRPPDAPPLSTTSISTADISSWNLPTILSHRLLNVKINRSRLIEESTYFQTLLAGEFSESSMCSISVYWSLETFLPMLRFMHGFHLEVTYCSFLPLLQAAIYFGLERLILQCKTWFYDIMFKEGLSSTQLQLDDLIRFWDFGLEHAVDWIADHCTSFVAKNFMWAMSCDAFADLPYNFIHSCVKHPHLTVDSERHLCEALLAWLAANTDPVAAVGQTTGFEDVNIDECNQMNINKSEWSHILEEIRVDLLPLWFTMGKCRCSYFSVFAKHGTANTFGPLKRLPKVSNCVDVVDDWSYVRIRSTEYSKKLDLSGCPQITSLVLLLSLLRQSDCPLLLDAIKMTNIDLKFPYWLSLFPILSFEATTEVDISKCSHLHVDAAVDCFQKSFPSLRKLRMAYFLDFETNKFRKLLMLNSIICEVDLTVDISPLISSNVSVSYSESVCRPTQKIYSDMSSCRGPRPTFSNMSKLTLEGRTDFSDAELLDIAECCGSLSYLNIKGCLSVTDIGIASLIRRCVKLHSIIATDTSFGRSSILALCSRDQYTANSPSMDLDQEHQKLSDINLQMLHIGGCKGVCETSFVNILSIGRMLRSLCLRDTCLVDQALYSFSGSALEMLDVSNMMISRDALMRVIVRNPGMKYLEASGCRNLCLHCNMNEEDNLSSWYPCEKILSTLGKGYQLEKLAIGWGFSDLSINAITPAFSSLKALSVGLGGSLGPEGLNLLCTLCPLLESVSIKFQLISDAVIMKLLVTLGSLQELFVCYCTGDLSPRALDCEAPHLRKLKLERVTPWFTNDNLALLTQNCVNIIELSLVGCTHLDADAQQIISSGWPGLISLHLEDCGSVTSKGIDVLLDCKAMEDLLLRHNGCGIQRNFITHAASKLPMLRSLSLDWCDAIEGDLDLPNFSDRYSLCNVKISKCKLRKCSLDFLNRKASMRPFHKETLVLVWNSKSLQRTVIKERVA